MCLGFDANGTEAPLCHMCLFLRANERKRLKELDLSQKYTIPARSLVLLLLWCQDGPDGLVEHLVQPLPRHGRALHLQILAY